MKSLSTPSLSAACNILALASAFIFASATASAGIFQTGFNTAWTPTSRPEQLTVTSWNTPVGATVDPLIPAESENTPTGVSLSLAGDAAPVAEITDSFFGILDLTVEGLSPGQTVLVEKFAVVERDGMADELFLRESNLVTDGGARRVGEVFNFNLANDITERDGRIVVQLDFYEPTASSIVGKYLFRISSPNGAAFTPLETSLTVVSGEQFAPQGLQGTVTSGGEPVPGATMVKMWPLSGYADLLSGTVADEDGFYVLPSEERNEFDFIAVKEGYVGNFGAGTGVNLVENSYLNHDIELEKGTEAISGTLRDAETGAPIPGVEIFLFDTTDAGEFASQKFSVVWTDSSGDFIAKVTPGKWGFIVRAEIAAKLGYVSSAEIPLAIADTTSGDVFDLTVPMKRGESVIWGFLDSTAGGPIPGVEIMAINQDTGGGAIGLTDGDGRYRLAVTPGRWRIFPFSYSLEDSDHSGVTNEIVDMPSGGQSVLHSITARPKAAELFGVVTDTNDNPIGRLRLRAQNKDLDINENVMQYSFETDGEYNIFLPEGDWSVIPEPRAAAQRDEKLIFIDQVEVTVDPEDIGFDGKIEANITAIRVDENTPKILFTLTDSATLEPIEDVYLHAFGFVQGSILHSYAITGANGVAVIPVLFDGVTDWKIHVSAESLHEAGKKEIEGLITVTVNGAVTESGATTQGFENPSLIGSLEILEDKTVKFSSTAESGRGYYIQASTDLVNWMAIGRVRGVAGEVRMFDQSTMGDRRFYRLAPEVPVTAAE